MPEHKLFTNPGFDQRIDWLLTPSSPCPVVLCVEAQVG